MKKYTIISLFLSIFLLTTCSANQVSISKTQSVQAEQESFEDELLNEFEDELQVKKKSDPFSAYNRVMTNFNDDLYEYFLLPVSQGYKKFTHKQVRDSVGNFFDNLLFPVRFVNNVLQGKIGNAADELGRFMINSTLGMAGLFDPAYEQFGIKPHKEDFGQTLGYWGVEAGPHIVLPFFGPSNLRDLVGIYPDSLINPLEYYGDRNYNLLDNKLESIGVKTFDRINETALQDQYGILKKDAVDLYPYLKNSYEQYRTQQLKE